MIGALMTTHTLAVGDLLLVRSAIRNTISHPRRQGATFEVVIKELLHPDPQSLSDLPIC